MSENEQSSTRSWLSVSQAAAALGISERTTRRMCESGKLAATIETGNNGGRIWRVDRAAISERAATLQNDRADSVRPNRAATEKTSVRPQSEHKNERAAISANVVRPTVRPTVQPQRAATIESVRPTENNALLIAEKNERISDLRAQVESQKLQIEAANRQAAEATAALREYLKMQARALPEPISSTRNDAENLRENALHAPINAATGEGLPDAQKAVKREMRPLWKVILGVR